MGICYRILDLGTQQSTYQGQPRTQHLLLFAWELPEEKMADGKPMMVAKRYTLSMNKKAILRKDLESWRAKAFSDEELETFDILNVLGAPALLTLAKSDNGDYTNVVGVAKLPKGTQVPTETANEKLALVLTPADYREDVYGKLSDKLKELIAKSPEYQSIKSGKPIVSGGGKQADPDPFDDEIPF